VLFAGVLIAGATYWQGTHRQAVDESATNDYEDGTVSVEDSKRLSRDVEMTWGKLAVLNQKFSHLADELEEPQSLAIIVLVVSGGVSGICFYLAREVSDRVAG